MDDFETRLTQAFLTPADEADDLTDEVMDSIAHVDRRRPVIVAGAGLIGLAVAAGIIGASQAVASLGAAMDRIRLELSLLPAEYEVVARDLATPVAAAVIGLFLLAAAAARLLVREP